MADVPNDPRHRLDLVVPWDLPLDQPLVGQDRQRVRQALRQLLQALRAPAATQACLLLDQALSQLGTVPMQPALMASTRTPLRVEEVVDYDCYFGLQHVHTPAVALCLVQGLLVTCHRFMSLCAHTTQLNPAHIDTQKQGFVTYVYLLARVFHVAEQDIV